MTGSSKDGENDPILVIQIAGAVWNQEHALPLHVYTRRDNIRDNCVLRSCETSAT